MTDFVQIHFLTAYPASCLVRDDTGRPKSMMYGGQPRGRISSAALKRAIRTSEEFRAALDGHLGTRTQRLGVDIDGALAGRISLPEERRRAIVRAVIEVFGKPKDERGTDPLEIEQLAFLAPEEVDAATALALELAETGADPATAGDRLRDLIRETVGAVDVALFGRMFANRPEMRVTAAAEVAHPFTVAPAETEVDFYVAVDDLNDRREDSGSAFIGEQGFLAGLFYGYACVNRDLLVANLGGDATLADRALAAFVTGLATVSPAGKRAAFGTRARASYLRVERGPAPRSLAAAFLRPVRGDDHLKAAVDALEGLAEGFARAYGDRPATAAMRVGGEGSLRDVIGLATGPAPGHGDGPAAGRG